MIFRAVEDADLIARVQKGDVEAFNHLVSRWEKRVYNYLLRIVRNREEALDLSQDVFLKAYQNLRKLEDPARFAPWGRDGASLPAAGPGRHRPAGVGRTPAGQQAIGGSSRS